jgi:hypothetical protein
VLCVISIVPSRQARFAIGDWRKLEIFREWAAERAGFRLLCQVKVRIESLDNPFVMREDFNQCKVGARAGRQEEMAR